MKLKFMVNNIKRDLGLIQIIDGNKANLYEVIEVINRWEKALEDENRLKEYEQRFQNLLVKEPFTREDFLEGTNLLLLIHQPLIAGRHNVMAVRMRDADYLRLANRAARRPVEEGINDLNKKIAQMEREEKERKRLLKEQAKVRQREIIEVEITE